MVETTAHGPGRPRDERADEAILRAAVELLDEVGLSRTTVAAVAKRAGVARATVYLRWPSHDALIAAAARAAIRRPPFPLTGDLETDLHVGSAYTTEALGEESLVAIFPELVRGVLATPAALDFNSLAPNRQRLAEEYRQTAAEQGFRADIDPMMPFDIIFGAHLAYLFASGRAMSAEAARTLADIVIAGLKRTA